ncbi:MAG: M23 family metallopeptidase [Actinomycetota bacterium]
MMSRRGLIVCLAVLSQFAIAVPADAYNTYWSSWRRWPWRNSTSAQLTQVNGHTYASNSARQAIDIGMRYETVYSVLPGVVHQTGNDGRAGTYLMVLGDDGTYYTYQHLDSTQVLIGTRIMLGDPVAISGNSGNSTGPHLHLQRATGPRFSDDALTLFPISGKSSASAGSWYLSDNAGIGRTSSNQTYGGVRLTYDYEGGYAGVGVPVAISQAWMPCRASGKTSTRWMYKCRHGFVQTFQYQSRWQTIMAIEGVPGGVLVTEPFLAVYTELFEGVDWVEHIGFPVERAFIYGPGRTAQQFEGGWITVDDNRCETTVWGRQTVVYKGWC